VLKRTRSNGTDQSKKLGLAREFKFYEYMKSSAGEGPLAKLALYLPGIMYVGGAMETGRKDILMQDLTSAVQSGYFFGPFSPLNWGKDLAVLTRGWDEGGGVDAASVTILAFTAAASLHAPFWNKYEDLKQFSWLKCVHVDEALWIESQQQAASAWEAERAKPVSSIDWHPQLVACLEASLARARVSTGGWATFQTELKTRPLTLVHGDFHPGNMMLARDASSLRLYLLDWEVVDLAANFINSCVCARLLNRTGSRCWQRTPRARTVPHLARVASSARGSVATRCRALLQLHRCCQPLHCGLHVAG
jgi:hypothetical protein